ncbi:hypothetical protein Tco_0647671, partial [Tanacetum coccineum]
RVHDLDGDEVVVESEARAGEKRNIEEVVAVIDNASISVSVATTTVSVASEIPTVTAADELTLAQTLAELKSARPPTQGISFKEPSAATTTTTTTTITTTPKNPQDKGKELAFKLQAEEEEEEEERLASDKAQQQDELINEVKARLFVQFLEQRRKHFTAKRAKEKRNKPPIRAQQRSIMCTYLKNMEGWKPKSLKNKSFANIQELFDKAMNRANTFIDYRTELVEESSKKAEAEIAHESSLKRVGEELEQESSKREDLEVLWSIVKARFKKPEPVNYIDNFLLLNLKTMFEHHIEDSVWKNQQGLVKMLNWKLYDSCGVHCVTMRNMLFYLLVEKIYLLTNHTLHQMFNDVKLQVDYECEMAFELLRLVKRQLKEGYVPE